MNEQILFDRLRCRDRLMAAGIPEEQARAHADAIDDALRYVGVVFRQEITRLEAEIASLRMGRKW